MNLIHRIEKALQRAGKNKAQLARAIGLTPQVFTNLKQRPTSTLKIENLAKAARYLDCDIYWLCTGEGDIYVPQSNGHRYSAIAMDAAEMIDSLADEKKLQAYAVITMMTRGKQPQFVDEMVSADH